jgi:hypothetical protein
MPNIKPVSDLRNYNEVLRSCQVGEPVFLTKNGSENPTSGAGKRNDNRYHYAHGISRDLLVHRHQVIFERHLAPSELV